MPPVAVYTPEIVRTLIVSLTAGYDIKLLVYLVVLKKLLASYGIEAVHDRNYS